MLGKHAAADSVCCPLTKLNSSHSNSLNCFLFSATIPGRGQGGYFLLLPTTVDTNVVSTPNLHSDALEALLMGSLSMVLSSGPTVFQQQTEIAGKKATASKGTKSETRGVVGRAGRHKDAINDGSRQVDWRV